MYCPKCGKKIEENTKYCSSCGASLIKKDYKKKDNVLILSVVALVTSFVFCPLGLILSIVGLINANKYNRENEEKTSLFWLDIAGIVVSSIEILLTTISIIFTIGSNVLLIGGILSFLKLIPKEFENDWQCSYTNEYYLSETANISFDSGNIILDGDKNYLSGSYYVNSFEIKDGSSVYEIKVNPDKYTLNGKEKDNETIKMIIKMEDDVTTISTKDLGKYYCVKKYKE